MLWELIFIIKTGGDSKLASKYLTIIFGSNYEIRRFCFWTPPCDKIKIG